MLRVFVESIVMDNLSMEPVLVLLDMKVTTVIHVLMLTIPLETVVIVSPFTLNRIVFLNVT